MTSEVGTWTLLLHLRVDWRSAGAAWDRALHAVIGAAGRGLATASPASDPATRVMPWVEYRLTDLDGSRPADWAVRVQPSDPTLLTAFVSVEAFAELAAADLSLLASGLTQAANEVASELTSVNWTGYLGLNPTHILVGPNRIGPYEFHSQRQYVTSPRARYGRVLRPLVVQGSIESHGWLAGRFEAGQQLTNLAALLSLSWHNMVEVLCEPFAPALGELAYVNPLNSDVQLGADHPVEIPQWLAGDNAWTVFQNSIMLQRAVRAHYEGLRLFDSHFPTMANMMMTVAIETTGRALQPHARPTARYRAALRLVLTEDSLKYTQLDAAYRDLRSNTVHEGELFGGEPLNASALHSGNPFLPRPDEEFIFDYGLARFTSRDILVHCLSNDNWL